MADSTSSTAALEGTPGRSFASRFLGVFVEPGETFEDIARKPDWISPLIVLVLVSFATVETMLMKIGAGQIAMQSIQQSGRATNLDPAQLSQVAHRSAGVMRVVMPAGALVGVPIFLLIVAGFGLLALNVFFGKHARFKDVFSVTCFANLPAILGGLMAIVVVLFGDADAFKVRNPAPDSLGFFMNPLTTSHAVYVLATSLNFIIFWFIALLAIGLSRVVRKEVRAGSIFLVYLGAWVLVVAVKVGLAMMF